LPEVRDFVWYYRAAAYRGLGDWKNALTEWRRITGREWRSPLAANSHFSIADAYIALGRWDSAIEQLDLVLDKFKRHDRFTTARFLRAQVAERVRDYEKAGELYGEIAFRNPLDYFADASLRRFERLSARRRIEAASFYDYVGRVDRYLSARALKPARAELETLQKRATSSSRKRSLQERWAKLAYREDRLEDARALYQELADATSGARKTRYLQWVSRSLAAQKRFDEAVDIYQTLASRNAEGRGRELLFKAAWLAYNGGRYERSLKLFRGLVENYGDDRNVDDSVWFIAWNAYRLGDHPTALQTLRTLRRDYPSSKLVQRTHYWEARILAAEGRVEEAARAYQKSIAYDPNDYYAVYA
ncbi:MAG: tetratricopeptide repeat protein, partial [Myxococcota bacterium]